MPDLSTEHIDVALTELSVAFTNEEYVAQKVFGVVPVKKRSDLYYLYDKMSFLAGSGVNANGLPRSIRRPKTRSTESDWKLSTMPFFAQQLARNYPISDEELQYEDVPLNASIDATMHLTEKLYIDNETAVAKKVMKRGNYPTANRTQLVTGTTSWKQNAQTSSAYTSFPISVDIPTAKIAVYNGMIRAANYMLLDYAAAVTLSQNWEYLEKIKYTSRDGLTAGGLAPVIEGLEVIESRPQYLTSADGVAETFGPIWQDDQAQDACLVFYREPGEPKLRMVTIGLTFEAPDATLKAMGFVVKRWREEWIDSERVEVRTTRDWRFVATDGSTSGDNAQGYALGGALISGCTL